VILTLLTSAFDGRVVGKGSQSDEHRYNENVIFEKGDHPSVVTAPPSRPVAAPPARRQGSVRRTSTVLMSWPDGIGSGLQLQGNCRDLLTPLAGEPSVIDRAELSAWTGTDGEIARISAEPAVHGLEYLLGCRAGGNLRAAISQELPEEVEAGTPIHLLFDDLAGSTLIAGFAYVRWADHLPGFRERMRNAPPRFMRDICSGFRHGASSLQSDGTTSGHAQNVAPVPPLVDMSDPVGWHELSDHPPMAMRRARRIDVWNEGEALGIDAMFRDSCWEPDGTEIAVHEYQISALADRTTGILLSVAAEPRVLPYLECPLAAPNATWVGRHRAAEPASGGA
jgi:hypothetical protein